MEVIVGYKFVISCFFTGWFSLFMIGDLETFELLVDWLAFIGADCVEEV